MTDKTSVDDIIGIVKTEEPTNSVQLKKEAQLSICEKRLIELEKENKQLYELIDFANTLIAFKTSESCQKEWKKRLKELQE